MGQNKIISIATLVFVSILSFCLGFILSGIFKEQFQYQNSITLADVGNIVIPCLVTLFAAWYLSKKLNEDRFAKELAINDLKEIEQHISAIINRSKSHSNCIIREILPQVNQLQTLIKRLERTCSVNGKKVPTDKVKNKFLCFYGCATNFGDKPLDVPAITLYGDELIIEIRSTIANINRM